MPEHVLTYFDIQGGRGDPIRIAFHAAGVPLTDHRISFQTFAAERGNYRFGCVPIMTIDGAEVTQSNAMLRYIGKQADLYPQDPTQALYCDEVLGACEDSFHQMVKTFGLEGDALVAAREHLTENWLKSFFQGLADLLERGGGEYFADHRLTVADLKIFVHTRSLRAGTLDHIPADLVDTIAPTLVAHQERIESDPIVVRYYQEHTS